ncbi:3-hydroxyisobutyrate dehydrogenase [Sedimentibacter acidaminivorans]|uniref:3-hydroxyisobutyrate dehydrogenase n=1 Tax=Sedimentibacter acidaminivorans TaxID=913099 RepID=A0ABS4GDV6_9FIRM|nr:NAD(P)-dependent oxidoreductase [Sedimentibacter acidaminivorans]MBP1925886.1 3-hydroxyisobutyrate dehydrogenase [Sedimentibacter acidaminivorans]
MKIGFIGLGVMGKNMATNLIKKGYNLKVSDLNKDAVNELKEMGAEEGQSASEVASGSDIVFTSLPNSQIVEGVVTGKGGILEGAKEGTIYIDLSSITPKTIQNIAKKASEKGVKVLDAPVSGGLAGAQKGTLTIMVGGDEETFNKALPVLSCIGTKVSHVGDIGAGDTMKLVNNLLLGINMVAVSEALALGVKAGLKPEVMYDIISQSSGSSYALTAKYKNFIAKGNFTPGFSTDLQYKDLQLAVDTAKDLKMPLLVGNVAQQMYEVARAKGLGTEDISAVIKVYEELGNIEVREEV